MFHIFCIAQSVLQFLFFSLGFINFAPISIHFYWKTLSAGNINSEKLGMEAHLMLRSNFLISISALFFENKYSKRKLKRKIIQQSQCMKESVTINSKTYSIPQKVRFFFHEFYHSIVAITTNVS